MEVKIKKYSKMDVSEESSNINENSLIINTPAPDI